MKLVISYYKDGTLRSVRSFEAFQEKGKSEREVLEQIEERNTQYGYERFKVEDVPDGQKELFVDSIPYLIELSAAVVPDSLQPLFHGVSHALQFHLAVK